jgi:hypothetical protein
VKNSSGSVWISEFTLKELRHFFDHVSEMRSIHSDFTYKTYFLIHNEQTGKMVKLFL